MILNKRTRKGLTLLFFLELEIISQITSVLNLYDRMISMVLYLSNHTPGTRGYFDVNQESKSYGKNWLWEIPEWNKMTHLSHCQRAQWLTCSCSHIENQFCLNRWLHRSHTVFCTYNHLLIYNKILRNIRGGNFSIMAKREEIIHNWLFEKTFLKDKWHLH